MSKIAVIGLDGATWSLMQPLIDAGKLPHLARLVQGGVKADLRSVPNMRSAAAWTSFMTGTNPGKHGIYEFYERVPGEYRIRFTNGSFRHGRAFWEILGSEGRKVGVVNVPMTYPAGDLNGFLIAGLDAPGKQSRGFCFPEDLLDRVERQVGEYVLEPGVTGLMVGGDEEGAEKALHHSITQRKKAFIHLMENEDWELFVAVFRETDNVHHCFWKFLEPDKVDATIPEGSPFRKTIEGVYLHLDEAVGEIVDRLPGDATVIVMSDHGFGFRQFGSSCLNGYLEKHGYLTLRKKGGGLLKTVYKGVEGLLKRKAKERLLRLLPGLRDRVQSRLYFSRVDWPRTRAYSDGVMPVVWINVKGRDPEGVVEPGAEYDSVVAGVTEALMEAVDIRSGRPVVEAVQHRDSIYHGPFASAAPDLLVQWKEDEPVFGLSRGGGGEPVEPEFPTGEFSMITGEHRRDGIFIARGPAIREGVTLDTLSIMDICPTVLFGMGSEIPSSVDGRPITEVFRPSFLDGREVKWRSDDDAGAVETQYREEDEATIRKRLRDLGYIE